MEDNTVDDQKNIKLMKEEEWAEHINQLLEGIDTILEENGEMTTGLDIATRLLRNDSQILRKEFEEFKEETIIRLDQEIENRTLAFQKIEALKYNTETKLERIEDILVVHRNQDNVQRKNYKALRDVWDETVLKIIEKGEHGKQK